MLRRLRTLLGTDLPELVLDRAPVAVVVVEGDALRVAYMNPAARTMAGADAGAAIEGRPLQKVVPHTRSATLDMLRGVMHSGKAVKLAGIKSTTIQTAQGGSSYLNIDCIPLGRRRSGNARGVVLLMQDVTDLVEVRTALAEREALLELALDVGEMGAWEYDPSSGSIRHSTSYTKIFGLAPDQRETDVSVILGLIHPDDVDGVQRALEAALADRSYLDVEHRIVRTDGSVRWVAMRARVLARDDHGGDRIIGVTIDMTQERSLRERIEQSNRALERFAHTVAHDLKSPLNLMLGFGGLIERSAAQRLTGKEREQLGYVMDAGRQMAVLIDGLLAYAQGVHGAPVREPVALERALAQASERLRLEIEASAAELSHDSLPTVIGNPVLLTQVLQNLIGNALKYRDRSRPLKIHISAEQRRDAWIVHVRDNGIGIPHEHQARLFEVFERGPADQDHEGLGLGLSLVRDAVQHHGGRVWVRSTPGHGSTFSFSIPSTAAADSVADSTVRR